MNIEKSQHELKKSFRKEQQSNEIIPIEVIVWITIHTSSNVELAALSNINKFWRDVITYTLRILVNFNIQEDNVLCNNIMIILNKFDYTDLAVNNLLLPCMMKEYNRIIHNAPSNDRDEEEETYCISWFAPKNIIFTSLPIYDTTNDDSDSDTTSISISTSDEEARRSFFKHDVHIVNKTIKCKKSCVIQWKSFTNILEVLLPFGYTITFLEVIFNDTPTSLNYAVRGPLVAYPGISKTNLLYNTLLSNHKKNSFIHLSEIKNKKEYKELLYNLPRLLSSNKKHTQRSIQFLNSLGTNATRLQSLSCSKVINQPIVVFCVGIAMEDGCFFSGLHSKFELGHLDEKDDDADCSPICISTTSNNYCKGYTVPGKWRLYTAIYNTNNSTLRVDGYTESTSNENCGDGQLDGITIGSDDPFHMSLCHGNDDEEEQEEGCGSISEIILFKGLLNMKDIIHIENYLMKRHNITPQTKSNKQEEEWKRDGHKLISSQPSSSANIKSNSSIPLRIMSGHKNVSWNRINEINGNDVPISKIGVKMISKNKYNYSSSDW